MSAKIDKAIDEVRRAKNVNRLAESAIKQLTFEDTKSDLSVIDGSFTLIEKEYDKILAGLEKAKKDSR